MAPWILLAIPLWIGEVPPDTRPTPQARAVTRVHEIEDDAVNMASLLTASALVTESLGTELAHEIAVDHSHDRAPSFAPRSDRVGPIGRPDRSIASVPKFEFVAPRAFDVSRVPLRFVVRR